MMILIKVFLVVLGLSLVGTVFFCLVGVVRGLGEKKLSQTLLYYLWILVVFKLLIPFQPNMMLGNYFGGAGESFLEPWTSGMQGQEASWQVSQAQTPISDGQEPAVASTTHEDPLPWVAYNHWSLVILQGAALLWAGGVLWTLGCKLRGYRQFQSMLLENKVPVAEETILGVFAQISGQSTVQLWQSELIRTPLLMGMRKPVIVLPTTVVATCAQTQDATVIKHILQHEWSHYQRKDLLYKWLVVLVCAVHWFNPVIRLLPRLVAKDGELACDEQVCQMLTQKERMAYGRTLLAMASPDAPNKESVVFCTTMGTAAQTLKSRLGVVKACRKRSNGERVMAAGLIMALGLTGALMGNLTLQAEEDLAQLALSEKERFVDELAASLFLSRPDSTGKATGYSTLDSDELLLNVTIPKVVPSGYQVAILVQNSLQNAKQFTEENATDWQPGQSYQTTLSTADLAGYTFQLGLISESGNREQSAYWATFGGNGFAWQVTLPSYADWEMAYLDVLRDFTYGHEIAANWCFGLADLSHDGIPEFFHSTNGGKDSDVYTFTQGKLHYLGRINGVPYQAKFDPKGRGKIRLFTLPATSQQGGHIYVCSAEALIEESLGADAPLSGKTPITYYPVTMENWNDLALIMTHYSGFKGNEAQLAAANQWALCYASRDGLIRYELLSPAKQAVFFEEDQTLVSDQAIFEEKHFISIRGSSPLYYQMTETLIFGEVDNRLAVVDYQTSDMLSWPTVSQP